MNEIIQYQPNEFNQRIKDSLKVINKDAPVVPMICERVAPQNVEALIGYWAEQLVNGDELPMPFEYPSIDRIANADNIANVMPIERDTEFFTQKQQELLSTQNGGKVEILAAREQNLVIANKITPIKILPTRSIFTDGKRENAVREKYNYSPFNFDRSVVTTAGLGENFRKLAQIELESTRDDGSPNVFYFVVGRGGTFGWLDAQDTLPAQGDLKLIEDLMQKQGYKQAFVDVPFLELYEGNSSLILTKKLTTPRGLRLGDSVWVKLEPAQILSGSKKIPYERASVLLPNENGIGYKKYKGIKRLFHIGTKRKDPNEAVRDFRKLVGNTYAWGGASIINEETGEANYGQGDCSGIIKQVMRMYGYELPNNSSQMVGMTRPNEVQGSLDEGVIPQELINTDKLIPGFSFYVTGTHVGVYMGDGPKGPLLLSAMFAPRFHFDQNGEPKFIASDYYPSEIDQVMVHDASKLYYDEYGHLLPHIPAYVEKNHPDHKAKVSQDAAPFIRDRMPQVIMTL